MERCFIGTRVLRLELLRLTSWALAEVSTGPHRYELRAILRGQGYLLCCPPSSGNGELVIAPCAGTHRLAALALHAGAPSMFELIENLSKAGLAHAWLREPRCWIAEFYIR